MRHLRYFKRGEIAREILQLLPATAYLERPDQLMPRHIIITRASHNATKFPTLIPA